MKELVKDLDIIALIRFGSHLYGTSTANSDMDYKGVFMPTKEMVLLGKIPNSIRRDSKTDSSSKNTSEDVDIELYSLHYFLKLACKGETAALDMLHVNKENLIMSSDIWRAIVMERTRFFTKNLRSFVGYARRQAAKYGVKGSRLNAARSFIEALEGHSLIRLDEIWDILPENDHSRFVEDGPKGIKQYQICGKILQERITVEMARNIMSGFLETYGKRAELAAENKGIDWKAISHALRAAYQTKEILVDGEIKYPLAQAKFLTDVKIGSLDFLSEVLPVLEAEMEEVERLSTKSVLPDAVDHRYWDLFVVDTLTEKFK